MVNFSWSKQRWRGFYDTPFLELQQVFVYPYEYKDSCVTFQRIPLPFWESFYSNMNIEVITKNDDIHACDVWNTFNMKNAGDFLDLRVQRDTLLIADHFEIPNMSVL